MVIDCSAVIAILLGEPEAKPFAKLMASGTKNLMGVFSALEASIVISFIKGQAGGYAFEMMRRKAEIEVIPMTKEQFEIAKTAWVRYGKGNHPAALDIGDCCSYALSIYLNEPLLYKGENFKQTDIVSAY